MPSIAGQTILVIGGSSGIGKAVAHHAVMANAKVYIASSNATRVENAVQAIKKDVADANVTGFVCDIGNDNAEAELRKLFEAVANAAGRPLDHIAYTAARFEIIPLMDATIEIIRSSGHYHLHVPLLISKLAPSFMNKSHSSSLIFTGGRITEKPIKGFTIPTAAASGLFGTVRSLALELAPVRVNMVSPGSTDTELAGTMERRAEMRKAAAETALLGKIGQAEEVAEAYIYLMKDGNNTGTCISTSGGDLLQ